jgi:hypothetical protein
MQYEHINGQGKHVWLVAFESREDANLSYFYKEKEKKTITKLLITFSLNLNVFILLQNISEYGMLIKQQKEWVMNQVVFCSNLDKNSFIFNDIHVALYTDRYTLALYSSC